MNLVLSIWEIIVGVALILTFLAGVSAVTNPQLLEAKTFSNELSYILSLKTNDNTQITMKKPEDFNIKVDNNQINVHIKDEMKPLVAKTYLGNSKVTQKDNLIIIN